MKEMLYEGVVGNYVFQMIERNSIEIWEDTSLEFPESYILLKDGDVKDRKDFDMEVMSWFSKNVG